VRRTIDLNADVGESTGAVRHGDDEGRVADWPALLRGLAETLS